MAGFTYLALTVQNTAAFLVPFIFAAAVSSLVFFGLKAWHRKKHPDEEYAKESEKRKKEREKLKNKTMNTVTDRLSGVDTNGSEKAPNGLRSGKYKKKKKK